MTHLVSNRVLGLALNPHGVSVAEVAPNGGTVRKVLHAGYFAFQSEITPENCADLGRAFASFLKTQGISGRDAVIGLPVRWLISRRKDLPPSTEATAAASLRLQAESEFASELKTICLDFSGQPDASKPSSVLVVGTPLPHIAISQGFARGAGIRLRMITVTAAALAGVCEEVPSGLIVNLLPGGAELAIKQQHVLSLLRHVAFQSETDTLPVLASEVRRMMATVPATGNASLTIWDGHLHGSSFGDDLAQRLGLPITHGDLAGKAQDESGNAAEQPAAVALAVTAMQEDRGRIDFLHSRLAEPQQRMSRRPFVWGIAVAAALLLAAVVAVSDVRSQQNQLASLNARLSDMANDIHKAQSTADRLAKARQYTNGKPVFVACLAELTRLFPDEGSVYATGMNLRENRSGQLSGKAGNTRDVLSLLDRMKDDRFFASPKLLDMRDSGASGREVAFTISFDFRPLE